MENSDQITKKEELTECLRDSKFDRLGILAEKAGFTQRLDICGSSEYAAYESNLEARRRQIVPGIAFEDYSESSFQNDLSGYSNGFVLLRDTGSQLDLVAGGNNRKRFVLKGSGCDSLTTRRIITGSALTELEDPFLYVHRNVNKNNLFSTLEENSARMRKSLMFPSRQQRNIWGQSAGILGAASIVGYRASFSAAEFIQNPWISIPLTLLCAGIGLTGTGGASVAFVVADKYEKVEKENAENPSFQYGIYAIKELLRGL